MANKSVEVPQFTGATPAAEAPKAPPRSMFDATTRKLDVFGKAGTDPKKPIPGHELYWFDDKENYVSLALRSGYRFVTNEEVAMNDSPTSGGNTALDEKVRQVVSWSGDAPVYAYLMAIPEELYRNQKEGPGSIEEHHQELERQLSMGTYRMDPNDGRYTARNMPDGMRAYNLPLIKMGRYYKPPTN